MIVEEPRLFRAAPEALTVNARWSYPGGWDVTIAVRRGDERWDQVRPEAYSQLTTQELYDVLLADVGVRLGL